MEVFVVSNSVAARPQPLPTAPRAAPPGRALTGLTWLVAALLLASSLAGLLVDGVYRDEASTVEMFRGWDLVSTLVAPGIAVLASLSAAGSVRARLVTVGLLAYVVYTYAYYLFGTGFNDLFLLHVTVFATAAVALVVHVATADSETITHRFGDRTPFRAVASILGMLAVALGAMWCFALLDNIVTGTVPAGSRLVETDTIVHLGIALDLSLLVPLYAAAAVLLWRRAAWSHLLAAIALVAGVLHQVSYLVAMPFQVAAGVPDAVAFDPFEPVILTLYLVGTGLLLLRTQGPRTVY